MERDESKYVRVSQILSIFQAYGHVPKEKLKKAQDIGTGIHLAIEKFFENGFQPLNRKESPYFDSFLSWWSLVNPKPLLVEKRMYDDELKVTGKVDLVAEIGNELWIVDFKTGSWMHNEIWELQLHWYWMLLQAENFRKLPSKFLIVQLQKDGSPPALCEFFHNEYALRTCFYAHDCWRFFNKVLC